METLNPSWYLSDLNLLLQESRAAEWTKEENKRFERALAIYDEKTPNRWVKVAAMIPGKSVSDVMRQYMELEADVSDIDAGLVPVPGYLTSSFTLEMIENRGFEAFRKRPVSGQCPDHERKKGVPWTEDEHRRFLMGLQKHGKGDWRNISRNFVFSKTPTQVASHAQKYFMRQNSGGKDQNKRRPSIHDITTVHLSRDPPSLDNSTLLVTEEQDKIPSTAKILMNWNQSSGGSVVVGSLNSLFQFHSTRYGVHG